RRVRLTGRNTLIGPKYADKPVRSIKSSASGVKGGVMAKKGLRLNEVRVLLALKGRGRPLTIDEIVAATADDTPNKEGISKIMVTRALKGMEKSEKAHEHTGYP